MKKKTQKQYGEPILLYPGLTLRAGSIMQIAMPTKSCKKESVDKFVDNIDTLIGINKTKHPRAVCLKNKQ
jgi:hypothetical protein